MPSTWRTRSALLKSADLWDRRIVVDHLLPRLARRYAVDGKRQDLLLCAQLFDRAPSPRHAAQLLKGVEEAFRGRPMTGLPDELLAVPCDVTDADAVDAAFTTVEEKHGPVQVLVSNAGITDDGLLMRMSEESFTRVVDANLTAAYRVAKRATRGMLKARSGRMTEDRSIPITWQFNETTISAGWPSSVAAHPTMVQAVT